MLLPRDPRRFKMTVHFSLRAATHTDTHTPASSEAALGWSISRSVFILPLCWWYCVCVRESRLEQRSYSDSDNEDGDGNEDGADGLKHMTAFRSPPQNQRALWFLRGSLKLPKPISGTYFRLFSGYFILTINGGPSNGKTELRSFTLCVCETLNGPCCCVKPPCFQFGELEESGVLLFG